MASKARGLANLGNAFDDGALSNRNKIINGAMVIDQRNAGAAVTVNTNPVYSVDRWYGGKNGTVNNPTIQRSSDAPSGFANSLLVTAGTGVAPASSDFLFLSQAIEGFNFADLNWGSAGAQTVTISFWARSSLTGNFGVGLRNGATNRSYIASYTISAANTWEHKTVTIEGDTTGTWATDNTQACGVFFDLGNGTTFSAATGSWQSANLLGGLTGGVKLAATTGATLNITGVQLEAGDTATPFEHRSYGQELALCQRYYYLWKNDSGGTRFPFILQSYNTSSAFGPLLHFPVEMRAAPTATAIGSYYPNLSNGSPATDFSSLGNLVSTPQSLSTGGWQGSASLTAGNATVVAANTGTTISLSAEL